MRTKPWLLFVTVATLALASCAPSTPSVTSQPTATLAATPTATVDALKTPLPSQGWVTVQALNFAKGIAFSKSDPFTGYACGNVGIDVAADSDGCPATERDARWRSHVVGSRGDHGPRSRLQLLHQSW